MTSVSLHTAVTQTAHEIETMETRGAAPIAKAAATALKTQAVEPDYATPQSFRATMRAAGRTLHETRPTAVSLPNALRYVLRRIDGETIPEQRSAVAASVDEFIMHLEHAQEDLGRVGANRLKNGGHGNDTLSFDGCDRLCRNGGFTGKRDHCDRQRDSATKSRTYHCTGTD